MASAHDASESSDPSDLRLFIPGPTHVRRALLEAQARPMIGHRSSFMRDLMEAVVPGVAEALGAHSGSPFVLSCSSTQAMESVARSAVRPGARALHLVNGNFSTLWTKLSAANGIAFDTEERPWGQGYDEARTLEALERHGGTYDAVYVTHCATSTGALSDIAGVARAVRARQPDALVCVDVTSSAAGTEVLFDERDLDVVVGGVQKAWALPPVLALGAVSSRARARFAEVPHRGFANELLTSLKPQEDKGMPLSTPAIPVLQALRLQLGDIAASGGFSARFDRHRDMQTLVLDWAARNDFTTLAEDAFRSPTVTSLDAQGRFEIADLIAGCRERGLFLGGGYGKTKTTHWRIGHMGDHTPADVSELLAVHDEVLGGLGALATG